MKAPTLANVFIVCITIPACAGELIYYPCGPDEKCSCFPESQTSRSIKMDCSGRHLSNLTAICAHVGNARYLDVSLNNISGTIGHDDVDGCDDLSFLSLRNNSVSHINQSTFKKLANLKTLDLSHNKIPIYSNVSKLLFADLVSLETLKVNGNYVNKSDLSAWYPDLAGIKHLKYLYIDGLPKDDEQFPKLTELQTLDVSGIDGICGIEKINDHFLAGLSQLQTLNMSSCKLVNISLNAFSSLRNLKRLDLSLNRRLGMGPLFNVSYGLQFSQIEFVNYSYVYSTFGIGVEVLKQDVCWLRNTTVRELALDGNRIEMLETNVPQLMPTTLHTFHMNDNKFTFGPYLMQLACTSNVREIYIGFQNIAHDPSLYQLEPNTIPETREQPKVDCPFMTDKYLEYISNLTENCPFFKSNKDISMVPAFPKNAKKVKFNDSYMKYKLIPFLIIPFKNNLEYADISGNVLYNLEGPVGPAPKLKHVDFSRNYCTHIGSKFFEYFIALENLQIQSNFLGLTSLTTDAPLLFNNLSNLKTINVSLNKITSLNSKTFEGLKNLETIDLSYNSIADWNLDVVTMLNLTNVNLSNNGLQSLPASLYKHLEQVSGRRGIKFTIDLRNNSLKYGCPTKDFLFWMVDHKDAFVGFREYVFLDENNEPVHDIQKQVNDLHKKCKSNLVWVVLSSIGVSVAFSVILFGIVYRNRWKLRYFMYMSKQRFYGYVKVPNDEPLENFKYDAFVSYEERTIRFIKDMIIPKLEQSGVCLCVHQRDFLPGNAIADNIVDAIQSSRKTVVLLTKAFLKSKWCMYEFNMARMENIYSRDGRGCLVLVMLEEVPAKDMSPELLDWVRRESYLEYSTDKDGENLFWNNLRDAIRQ